MQDQGNILVVGGAGYIGSHLVRYIRLHTPFTPVVLDNFSSGHREAVNDVAVIEGDIGDDLLLDRVFSTQKFVAVMHFASSILVGESVSHPAKYYDNNVARTITLLNAMVKHSVPIFIFSSTAAVYGNPTMPLLQESHPLAPINPYGRSKKMVEELLVDYASAYPFRYGCLRYFNAAGADPSGDIGELHDPETHLIPLVLQAASGRREAISVFGQDYPTPDGTCLRDYVHVNDLADAHYKLLRYLQQGGAESVFNLGTGQGYSVREVIEQAKHITGKSIIVREEPRRAGDPAVLVADGSKAQAILGWQPQFSDLTTIITHAWAWEQSRA